MSAGRKPDVATAMRDLIGQVREAMPFDAPEANVCSGLCEGCSLKLLEYMAAELDSWEQRLADGEQPGLKDLSKLAKTARKVHATLVKNGLAGLRRSTPRGPEGAITSRIKPLP